MATPKKSRISPQRHVEMLLMQRRRMAETEWNAIGPFFGGPRDRVFIERDPELVEAVAAWRERQLAAIDKALVDFGIAELAEFIATTERLREDARARQLAVIDAALVG